VLTRLPNHALAHVGLAALGTPVNAAPHTNGDFNTVLAHAATLSLPGEHASAARVCREVLAKLPLFASDGWLLPIEPLIRPSAHADAWAETLALVSNRAS
jgi:hypothetical protein